MHFVTSTGRIPQLTGFRRLSEGPQDVHEFAGRVFSKSLQEQFDALVERANDLFLNTKGTNEILCSATLMNKRDR